MPGSVAARVMGWQRRMRVSGAPLGASGESSGTDPVQIELYINGSWVDITSYVMVRDDGGNIAISYGQRDEGSKGEQSSCTLSLDNRDGRWSPRNPTGAYYGYLGRNQELRISVPNGLGGKSYRFWGEVSSWPVKWDPTGTDVWAEIEAAGPLRRFSQGSVPVTSLINRAIGDLDTASLRAYWPCEDPSESIQIASAVTNGSPMVFSVAPDLATFEQFGASDPLPIFTGAAMSGGVTKYSDPTATQIRFLLYIPPEGTTDRRVIAQVKNFDDIAVTQATVWELVYNTAGNNLSLQLMAGDGSNFNDIADTMDVRGKFLRVSLEARENGANADYTLRLLNLSNGATSSATGTRTTEGLTRVLNVSPFVPSISAVNPNTSTGLTGGVMGHITVQDTITPMTDLGTRLSPAGEVAGRRIQRVCDEEGIPFDFLGDLDDTVSMGGQEKLLPLDVMREAELADDGMLTENRAAFGLAYRTRVSLCNQDPQLTLDYTSFQLAEVPIPVDDDQRTRNKVSVTSNSLSAVAEQITGVLNTAPPPAGIGVYGDDVTLNLEPGASLLDQATWRLHTGTVDESRFPQISINLAHSTFTANPALKQTVLALRQGDRLQVTNPPAWLPPDTIDQLILGFEETISHFEHRITFNCAPASPYVVAIADDLDYRIDTSGSELVEAATSSDTDWSVIPKTDHYPLWTTDSADLPFDIRAGGEVVTVTGVTGWLEDAFGRSVSNGWGTSDTGQSWSTGGGTAANYAVGSGVGSHTLASVDASRRTFVDTTFTEFDYYVDVTTSATATGGSLFGGPTGRYLDSSNLYQARMEFTTANALILSIRKIVNGSETQLGTYTLPDTYVAGTYYRIRFQSVGATLKAKAWEALDAVEMPGWQITVTDTAITTAAFIGVRSISSAANTNVNPVVSYDNLAVVSPQTLTVTRSVNGVVKAQTTGTDVRLARPAVISL